MGLEGKGDGLYSGLGPCSPTLNVRGLDGKEGRLNGGLGLEIDSGSREVFFLTSQLGDRERQVARLSQQLADLSRDHQRQLAELQRQMDEERNSWRAQLAQLAAEGGGKGGKPPSAVPRDSTPMARTEGKP
jgi:chromosome segregation ATPase